MVDFEGCYFFPADQVESVEVYTLSAGVRPYKLRVVLKSGRQFDVSYLEKATRDGAKKILCNCIECELRQESAQISNELFLIRGCVQRLDRRQLRIWRLLKQLLRLQGTIDDKEGGP